MPYAQLDDRYHDTKKIRKVLRIEPAAVAVHVMAITFCNQHNTDGEIESDRIDGWISLMPYKPAQRQRVLNTLLEERLLEWLEPGETFVVHDYLDWNRSRATRLMLAEQGRRGGHAKAARSGDGSSHGYSDGQSQGSSQGSGDGSSTPRHATPTPRRTTSEAEKHPVAAGLSRRLSDHVRRNDPKASPNPEGDSWVREMRLLLHDRTGDVAEVERIIDWCQTDPFWHSNILSPAKLRKQFTQLLLKASQNGQAHRENASDWLREMDASEAS